MLDPREHQKRPIGPSRAPATAYRPDATATSADRGLDMLAAARALVPGPRPPIERLYERFEGFADGGGTASGEDQLDAIRVRLAENRQFAENVGWTVCALDRDDAHGRLRLFGVAPAADARSIVPDWTAALASEAVARLGRAVRGDARPADLPPSPAPRPRSPARSR